jgi:scyllo-inositol 2-dehydrogenase (NADP+)
MKQIVLVGCGNITKLRHIPALKSFGDSEVRILGVIGLDELETREAARLCRTENIFVGQVSKLHFPQWLKDADLIIIGTPPQTHIQLLIEIVSLNPNARLIVEKPLSLGESEASRLAKLDSEKHRIFVMHNFQFASGFQKLVNWNEEGKLGNIVGVNCIQLTTKTRRLPKWHEDLPLGLFWDESVHFFYLLEALIGNLEVVYGHSFIKSLKTPEMISLSMVGERNIPATITMNFSSSISEWGLIVSCTEGVVTYDLFRDIAIFLPNDGLHLAKDVLRTSTAAISGHVGNFVRNGLNYIRGELHYGVDEVIRKVLSDEEQPSELSRITLESGSRFMTLMGDCVSVLSGNSSRIN